ncbi:MAG: GGDEF domain-containing protein [Alphaproteobacteria bacterium]
MQRRQIPPTPENYLVWYHVAADSLPALTRLIGVLDTQAVPYDDARNWELYERFFGHERDRSRYRHLGDRIQEHLAEIGALLAQIASGTKDYGDSLDGLVTCLDACDSFEELHEALATLRADTHTILHRTDHWQRTATAQADEVSKLKQELDAVRHEAETDALTKVGNRKRFDRRLRELATLACETGAPLSVILLDIDHFKDFNDTYGHQLGDRVLTLVTKRIVETTALDHEVFRYGGEEFVLLAANTTLGDAIELGENVRKAVSGLRIARKSDNAPLRRITLSVGISEYEPAEPLARVLERADAALYAAKNSGRNCTNFKRAKRALA